MCRALVATGGALGFLGVALGAFGAHALKDRISADHLATYQIGVHYHLIHVLAILFVALIADKLNTRTVGWLWVAGIVLFSGSLYALALTGIRILGAITPLGGVCFLAAWALLVVRAARASESAS
jgi:uncharacterized membrane protein YgdD (TMEM256/DUF423 family)